MQLLLLRHALAEEREEFALTGADDELRPLTRKGRKQMRLGARGLHVLVPRLDVIASSPLLRAQQTAEIVAREYGSKVVELPQLGPGQQPASVLHWLQSQGDAEVVALVGHEPDLGLLAAWLLTGSKRGFLPLKKGGACLIEMNGGLKQGNGVLQWSLPPKQMRALRD